MGDVVEVEAVHPRARALRIAERLDGRRLERVEARGKNLLLDFGGGVILRNHLMMRGRWRVRALRERPDAHGRPWLRITGTTHEATQWNGPILELGVRKLDGLGPDILDQPLPLERLLASLRSTGQSRSIGDALLDQRLVAGIGNLWRSEILFLAQVHPDRVLSELCDEELERLVRLASAAMRKGRSTPSVYRRARRPCRQCARPIAVRRVGAHARNVYWCPGCQAGKAADIA